jgi:hypothetical protein
MGFRTEEKTQNIPIFITWSLALREEHKLRVFQNRALKRLLGPNMDQVTGDLRKMHNEELHDTMINFMHSKRVVAKLKKREHLTDLCVDRSWIQTLDLIQVAQDRNQWRHLVNMVINLRVP